MARNSELNIIVKLRDMASKEMAGLTGSFIKAQLALRAIDTAANAAMSSIRKGLELSAQYEQATLSMQALSASTEEYARLQSLVSDNSGEIFTDTQIAQALNYAQAAGVNVETMEQLMPALKSSAVLFNEDLNTAITAVTRAMKFGEAELAERIGLQLREYAVMEQSQRMYGERLQNLNQEQKEQVILQAVLDQTANRRQVLERLEGSAVLSKRKLNVAVQDLQKSIGQALTPVIVDMMETLTGASDLMDREFRSSLEALKVNLYTVYQGFMMLGEAAWGLGRMIAGVGRKIATLGKAQVDLGQIWTETADRINDRNADISAFIQDMAKNSMPDLSNATKDVKKEFDSMATQAKEKLADMRDQMRGLVLNHWDSIRDLKSQIKDEKDNFEEQMADRKDAFNRTLADMESRHREKVATIKEQLQEEVKSFEQSQKDKERQYKRKTNDMERRYDKQVDNLKDRMEDEEESWAYTQEQINKKIDKEREKGAWIMGYWNSQADDSRIESLEDRLKEEKRLHADKMADLKAKLEEETQEYELKSSRVEEDYQRETERAKTEHQERLSDLQESLKQEKAEHRSGVAEKKRAEKEYTQDLREEHQERLTDLKSELEKELKIKKKHEDLFYKYRNAKRVDDITKLRQKMKEEKKAFKKSVNDMKNYAGNNPVTVKAGIDTGGVKAELEKATQQVYGHLEKNLSARFPYLGPATIEQLAKGNQRAWNALNSSQGGGGNFSLGGGSYFPWGGGTAGDFVWRPGENPIKFSPSDTIMGFKGNQGPTSGGDIHINIDSPVFNNRSDIDYLVDRVKGELGRERELHQLGAR